LHQWNVLAATRAPWLAIDPKGAVGEPAEEIGAWLVDRVRGAPTDAEARRRLLAMCDQLAEELGLDRARARRHLGALEPRERLERLGELEPLRRAARSGPALSGGPPARTQRRSVILGLWQAGRS